MNMKEIYNRFKTYLVEQDLKVPAEMEKDLEGPMPSPKDSSESTDAISTGLRA